MSFNPQQIRREFPFLREGIVYLDSAATAQKPREVLDAMEHFYETENANVHRGVHALSERATNAYEDSRKAMQRFINAKSADEIIFTKSCTEGLNLVAKTWGKAHVSEGDCVVLSILEHHSNILPWFQLREEQGIEIEWTDIDDNGDLQLHHLEEFLARGTVKLIGITGQSNVLGTRPPLEEIIAKAHEAGALVLVDAAQLIAHHEVDVQELDCDFLAFSGHKLYGPTGIGVLYGKREHLETMPPFLTGGGMVEEVTKEHFTALDLPQKFEAGTPPIAEAIGLKAAIEWLSQFKWEEMRKHETQLIEKAHQELSTIKGMTILGFNKANKASEASEARSGCLSFTLSGIHPHDLTDMLGEKGIFMRAGHHCAVLLHERFGVDASTRLSVGIYNTLKDIESVRPAIEEVLSAFL